MKTVYIGLGSNLGDSIQVVQESWARLGTVPGICLGKLSHPYLTEPVGMDSDNWFVNAAGQLRTSLEPKKLLHCMHLIEEQFGRVRDFAVDGYQDRVLDLDLLLYDQDVLQGDVHVPHPVCKIVFSSYCLYVKSPPMFNTLSRGKGWVICLQLCRMQEEIR